MPTAPRAWRCTICEGTLAVSAAPQPVGEAWCPACVRLMEEMFHGQSIYDVPLPFTTVLNTYQGANARQTIIRALEGLGLVPRGLLYRLLGRTDQPAWGKPADRIAGSEAGEINYENFVLDISDEHDMLSDEKEVTASWLAGKLPPSN